MLFKTGIIHESFRWMFDKVNIMIMKIHAGEGEQMQEKGVVGNQDRKFRSFVSKGSRMLLIL